MIEFPMLVMIITAIVSVLFIFLTGKGKDES